MMLNKLGSVYKWTEPEPYQLLQVLLGQACVPVPLLFELVPGGFGDHSYPPRFEPSCWFRTGSARCRRVDGPGWRVPAAEGSAPEPQQVHHEAPNHANPSDTEPWARLWDYWVNPSRGSCCCSRVNQRTSCRGGVELRSDTHPPRWPGSTRWPGWVFLWDNTSS